MARPAIDSPGLDAKVLGADFPRYSRNLANFGRLSLETYPPSFWEILRNLLHRCHSGGEFECATADCIAQPTFPIVGQVGRDRKKSRQKSHAAPRPQKLHAAHIDRGPFGPILLADPMFSVNFVSDGLVYKDQLAGEQRRSVGFFCADTVSAPVCSIVCIVLPNLQRCALIPTHLAAAVERRIAGRINSRRSCGNCLLVLISGLWRRFALRFLPCGGDLAGS